MKFNFTKLPVEEKEKTKLPVINIFHQITSGGKTFFISSNSHNIFHQITSGGKSTKNTEFHLTCENYKGSQLLMLIKIYFRVKKLRKEVFHPPLFTADYTYASLQEIGPLKSVVVRLEMDQNSFSNCRRPQCS